MIRSLAKWKMVETIQKLKINYNFKTMELFLLLLAVRISSSEHLTANQSQIQEYLDKERETTDRLIRRNNYDKRFIPAIPGQPLQVKLEIVVSDVLKVKNMELEMTVFIRQTWHDYRLSANYTGKLKVREHFLDKIWLPDVRIINLKDMKRFDGFGGINMNLYPSGKVYYSKLVVIRTSCPMDLHYFPMDKQTCYLNFSSFAYGKSLLTFHLGEKTIKVRNANLPQFKFIGAKEVIEEGSPTMSQVKVALKFKRRAGYYILQIFVPASFLVVLSWLAFLMESSNIADRLALEIAMILSTVFLLEGTNSQISHVSYAKASDVFVIVSFAFILLALLESMLVYRLSSLQESTTSNCSRFSDLSKDLSILLFKRKEETPPNEEQSAGEHPPVATMDPKEKALQELGKKNPLSLPAFVDKICLLTFPVLYVGFNVFFWLYYNHPDEKGN